MTEEHNEIAEDPPATDGVPARLSAEEMLEQLQVMARQIAGDAPPALRDASAVAAELGAIAARGTGPIAHTLADLTDDASLRFAARLEDYAANVRGADVIEAGVGDSAVTDDGPSTEAIDPAETADRG